MREVKFKGMTTKGKWIYGSLVNNCEGIKHKPETNTKTWIVESAFGNGGWFNIRRRSYVKPKTVCEFTGCYDLNLNEIYEGDRLEAVISGESEEFIVKFKDGSFIVCRELDNNDFYYLYDLEWTVTGNLHDS